MTYSRPAAANSALEALLAEARQAPAPALPALLEVLSSLASEMRARLEAELKTPPSPPKKQTAVALTFEEVAALIGVTPHYVAQLVKDGTLAHVRLPASGDAGEGRQKRILPSDLEALLEKRRVPAIGERGRKNA